MSTIVPSLAFAGLLIASLPPVYLFTTSSRLLLNYEDMTKKAAKVSNQAGHQLRKTRTTQGSAVIASVGSAFSAAYIVQALLFANGNGLAVLRSSLVNYVCLANLLTCSLVAKYVGDFWSGSVKTLLPGGADYRDAVRATEMGLNWLYRLSLGWGGVYVAKSLVGLVMGKST